MRRLGLAVVVSLAGCAGDETPQAAFANLTVSVEALGNREVRLENGRAVLAEEGVEILLDELRLTGTLDSSTPPVTTGIIYATRAGGETQTELVVAREVDGALTQVASHPLGGLMRVEGVRYEEGAIVLHLLEFDADDPPCCPPVPVQRRFVLENDTLTEVTGPT